MLVRIVKDWDWPDLRRQTPNHSGIWQDIEFTLEPVEECDYVIVLNGVNEVTTVKCPPEHIWSLIQEPPTEFRKPWHVNPPYSFRTFTTDEKRSGSQYVQSQPALGWHVNQDYDFLSTFEMPEKTRRLSWITSTRRLLGGHRARMLFLDNLRGKLDFDLIATINSSLLWSSRFVVLKILMAPLPKNRLFQFSHVNSINYRSSLREKFKRYAT